MAIGPGFMQLLMQPTHVNNPARGTGMLEAARIQNERKRQAWQEQHSEKQFEESKRRYDTGRQERDERFQYQQQEHRRALKAEAFDELQSAILTKNQDNIRAAAQKAQQVGLVVPGLEQHFAPPPPQQPRRAGPKAMSEQDAALDRELDAVHTDVMSGLGAEGMNLSPEQDAALSARPIEPIAPSGLGAFTGGGRGPLSIIDTDTGKPVGSFDYGSAMERARGRIGSVFDPMIDQARDRDAQRAASIAKDVATRLAGTQGYSVRDAIEAGQERYDKEMGRETAKAVARGGKPETEGMTSYERGGRSPEQVRTAKTVGDYVHLRIIQKAQYMYSTKELQAASKSAQAIAAKMRNENPVAQRGAIRDVIMMTEGKRSTDTDLKFALTGGGALSKLHMDLLGWVQGGKVPDNLKEKFGAYANMLSALNKEHQVKAMRYAEELVYEDPGLYDFGLSPEDKAYWARQAKRGVAGESIGLSPRGKAEKEVGERALEGGEADAEADDVMKELE